jgi:hypothetical protein
MDDYCGAQYVLVVHVEKHRTDAKGNHITDFAADEVLKPHSGIKVGMIFTIDGTKGDVGSNFIVFGEEVKGKHDLFKGMELRPGSKLKDYFVGAIKLKDSKREERLRYCFDFLDSKEQDIFMDAFKEFAKSEVKDLAAAAKGLPADKIASKLKDAKDPDARIEIDYYGLLLGYCGKEEYAKLLRSVAEESVKKKSTRITGVLVGYVMLQPKEGWAYVRALLGDAKQDWSIRRCAIGVASFMRDNPPESVEAKELADGVAQGLDQADMAFWAINFLRKAKRWDRTAQVLAVYGKKEFYAEREVLRFALQSPEPSAAAFVKEQRRLDPVFVAETEKFLKMEKGQ